MNSPKKPSMDGLPKNIEDIKKPTYYKKSLQYYLGLGKGTNEFAKLYKDHFIQTIAAIKFIGKLRIPSDETLNTLKVQCAKLSHDLKDSKNHAKILKNSFFWFFPNF